MLPRALITGVPGFAGSFLAEHLLDCGDRVLGCSPDGQWEPRSPPSLGERVELVAWDLGSQTGLSAAARRSIEQFRPQVVYHLAALSVPEDCGQQEPTPAALAVNVEGTRRVLELVASLPGRPRVLFVSSNKVYAPVSARQPVVDETAPLGPDWAYGKTKLAAEGVVRRAHQQHGCHVVIARSFQHTGPRQDPRMMLPQWARQFALGGTDPVEIHTHDAWLDLSDVRDVVRAYRLLAERGRPGEVYNVGSGRAVRSGDVLELLQSLADSRRRIVELYPEQKHEPVADLSRLVQRTGWRATIPLKQTVADTLAWWRQQGGRPGPQESKP